MGLLMYENMNTLASISVEDVKKYNTDELISLLRKQDLGLIKEDFDIIETERINGRTFFKTTKQDFRDYGMKGGPATALTEFANEIVLGQDEAGGSIDEEAVEKADGVDEVTGRLGSTILSDIGISDGCKSELKSLANRLPSDNVGMPSLSLAFLHHMGFLKEGNIVRYCKKEATFHENPATARGDPCYLSYSGEKHDSIQKFVDKVNGSSTSRGDDYKNIAYNGIRYDELRNKVGKIYRLMQIVNEAINN
ncbi:uncharacterized protein OCT59_015444 [Rhizophagus irregularis]|nr:hypothetical protein OCT59_015444 [Rhizophagus irregularis]